MLKKKMCFELPFDRHPEYPSSSRRIFAPRVPLVTFFLKGLVLRVVESEPLIIAINAHSVRDYLRDNHTVRFCHAPPVSLRTIVPVNSWVVNTGTAGRAVQAAREIKRASSLRPLHQDQSERNAKLRFLHL